MRRGAIEIGPDERKFIDYLNLLAEKRGITADNEKDGVPADADTAPETLDLSQFTTEELREMIERLTDIEQRRRAALRALRRRRRR